MSPSPQDERIPVAEQVKQIAPGIKVYARQYQQPPFSTQIWVGTLVWPDGRTTFQGPFARPEGVFLWAEELVKRTAT